jgi:hypothetical protein
MQGKTIIKVQGHLDKKWKECFESMEINYNGNTSILTENIKDEAHLHGILNLIRDLNLTLISVNPAGKKTNKTSG